MRFDLDAPFEGQRLLVARDLLRTRRSTITLCSAMADLELSKKLTSAYLRALVAAGYLEPDPEATERNGEPTYAITRLGISLSKAKKRKRLDRAGAEAVIEKLLTTVEAINSNPELLCWVDEIYLFGSYTRPGDDIGDVDVAYSLERRPTEASWVAASVERAKNSGRRVAHLTAIHWGYDEVELMLKKASRYLDLQPKRGIVDLGWELVPLFRRGPKD